MISLRFDLRSFVPEETKLEMACSVSSNSGGQFGEVSSRQGLQSNNTEMEERIANNGFQMILIFVSLSILMAI